MKIQEMPETIRSEIEQAIESLSSQINTVRETHNKIADVSTRLHETNEKERELSSAESPLSEKDVQRLVIARTQIDLLSKLDSKFSARLTPEIDRLLSASQHAAETFRRAIGAELEENQKSAYIATLPPEMQDQNRWLQPWSTSRSRYQLSRFLNPPPSSRSDDIESILEGSEEILERLNRLNRGEEIVISDATSQAA